jgi:hypothetical protein
VSAGSSCRRSSVVSLRLALSNPTLPEITDGYEIQLHHSMGHDPVKPFCSSTGPPSVDPELMMRMLIVGYAMGIRSERRLCEEVYLNLAYRWFCRFGLDGKVPDPLASRGTATAGSGTATSCDICLRLWWSDALHEGWSVRKDLLSMPACWPLGAGISGCSR